MRDKRDKIEKLCMKTFTFIFLKRDKDDDDDDDDSGGDVYSTVMNCFLCKKLCDT